MRTKAVGGQSPWHNTPPGSIEEGSVVNDHRTYGISDAPYLGRPTERGSHQQWHKGVKARFQKLALFLHITLRHHVPQILPYTALLSVQSAHSTPYS